MGFASSCFLHFLLFLYPSHFFYNTLFSETLTPIRPCNQKSASQWIRTMQRILASERSGVEYLCAAWRRGIRLRALRSYSYAYLELRRTLRYGDISHILDLPLCPPDRARSQKSFSNKLSSEDLNAIIVSITDIDSSFLVHC